MREEGREGSPARVLVPRAPVLVAGFREVVWLSPDGEIEALAPTTSTLEDVFVRTVEK